MLDPPASLWAVCAPGAVPTGDSGITLRGGPNPVRAPKVMSMVGRMCSLRCRGSSVFRGKAFGGRDTDAPWEIVLASGGGDLDAPLGSSLALLCMPLARLTLRVSITIAQSQAQRRNRRLYGPYV